MARIAWDKPGEKRYESGVDRGVLYLANGKGVAWNGLTGVEEDMSSITTNPYYYDGTKYLDTRYPGDFEATLTAYTYPDEFLLFDGYSEINNGVLLAHQPVYERFGLAYRTRIGNDTEGNDHGYKIHILYNLVATPTNRNYKTLSDNLDPTEFAWSISGVPEPIAGHRPTVHVVLDTTRLNPYLVRDVEDWLYGTDATDDSNLRGVADGGTVSGIPTYSVSGGGPSSVATNTLDGGTYRSNTNTVTVGGPVTQILLKMDGGAPEPSNPVLIDGGTPSLAGANMADGGGPDLQSLRGVFFPSTSPQLPPLQQLVELLNSWVLVEIVDNGDGTWTADGPPEYVKYINETTFEIVANGEMVNDTTYRIGTTNTL